MTLKIILATESDRVYNQALSFDDDDVADGLIIVLRAIANNAQLLYGCYYQVKDKTVFTDDIQNFAGEEKLYIMILTKEVDDLCNY